MRKALEMFILPIFIVKQLHAQRCIIPYARAVFRRASSDSGTIVGLSRRLKGCRSRKDSLSKGRPVSTAQETCLSAPRR